MSDKDKSFNAAEESQVKDRKRKDERLRDIELADMKKMMSTCEGRRFVWRLLDRAGVFRTSFTGNSTTFFNEGQRNIGLIVLADVMAAAADQYVVMMNESKEDDRTNG
jgi:hypothetical protein